MTLPLIGSTTMKPLLPALLLGLAGFSTQAAELRFVEQDAPADTRLWLEQQLGVTLSDARPISAKASWATICIIASSSMAHRSPA